MPQKKTTKKTQKNLGPVKLKYSKVVRPRRDQVGNVRDTVGLRYTKRTTKGVTLPRPIQLYRYWFLYLKLALELESVDYYFREYQRVTRKSKKSVSLAGTRTVDRPILERVSVNRDRYVGWDVDQILTSRFDEWWRDHKGMFIDEPTIEIDRPSQVIQSSHFRYFRVDTRKTLTDTFSELKHHLAIDGNRRGTVETQYKVSGKMREEALFNRYNALIMNIEGMKSPDVLKSGLFRTSRQNVVRRSSNSQRNSQKMRDLLQPAKRLVLTVADGYFMKHPRDKQYFKRR